MDLKAFMEKGKADPEFAAKFKGIDSAAELVAAAAKEGYTFTEAEINKAGELSDDDLDNVAGGASGAFSYAYFIYGSKVYYEQNP